MAADRPLPLPILLGFFVACSGLRAQVVTEGKLGHVSASAPEQLRNPWPEAWERAFQERRRHVIKLGAKPGRYGSTWFENEKRSYGRAMLAVLGGFERQGLAFLQAEDAGPKAWSAHTAGIDFFPAFTLKHQVRKFFLLGDNLDAGYRARMLEGARAWTARDPLRRPHPAFKKATGWTPEAKNSWVDVRDTDNLKLMRDVAVYLFAEASGNEQTRALYKRRLTKFVVTMYRYGQGEWDSENYHGHSLPPLLNLYDFAKDEGVRALAKAGLDWMCAAGAVKYWRGAFNGPSKRDYNHPFPFGGSAPCMLWLWFGGPTANQHLEADEVHALSSAYRPPAAVVELAQRAFARPCTVRAGKPAWQPWKKKGKVPIRYEETQHFGRTYQLGTLLRGTQTPDVNGFKMLAYSEERGADVLVAAPCSDATRICSPQYADGILGGPSIVAHDANRCLYLTKSDAHPFRLVFPETTGVQVDGSLLLLSFERSFVALRAVNAVWKEATDVRKRNGKAPKDARWASLVQIEAEPRGKGMHGAAFEIADASPDLDAEAFAQRVRGRSRVEVTDKHIRFVASSDKVITIPQTLDARELRFNDQARPAVAAAYASGASGPIHQCWGGPTLRVASKHYVFESTVDDNGVARFANRRRE